MHLPLFHIDASPLPMLSARQDPPVSVVRWRGGEPPRLLSADACEVVGRHRHGAVWPKNLVTFAGAEDVAASDGFGDHATCNVVDAFLLVRQPDAGFRVSFGLKVDLSGPHADDGDAADDADGYGGDGAAGDGPACMEDLAAGEDDVVRGEIDDSGFLHGMPHVRSLMLLWSASRLMSVLLGAFLTLKLTLTESPSFSQERIP